MAVHDDLGILREVSTTASAHGSNALSTMIGKKITLNLPMVGSISETIADSMGEDQEIAVVVQCKLLSGLEGKVILVLKEKVAFKLINLCCKKANDNEKTGLLTEVGLSALKEIGNVVVSSYAGALSMFLNTVVIPSPPTLLSGPFTDMIRTTVMSPETYYLAIDTVFEEGEEQITGRMVCALTEKSMILIQNACKKMLKNLER